MILHTYINKEKRTQTVLIETTADIYIHTLEKTTMKYMWDIKNV